MQARRSRADAPTGGDDADDPPAAGDEASAADGGHGAGGLEEPRLVDAVAGASDEELAELWRRAVATKLPGHGINEPGFLQPARPMSAIGG